MRARDDNDTTRKDGAEMFFLRIPNDFTPEDYGWERQDDITGPYQQHPNFGVWRRKREPPTPPHARARHPRRTVAPA